MTGKTPKTRGSAKSTGFCRGFKRLLAAAALLPLLALVSCRSSPKNTIANGTGTQVGTASASVTLTENRATGEITGDTKKYGFFETMPDVVVRQLKDNNRNVSAKGAKAGAMSIAEKAYAVAVYDIIQQVRAKGGDAVTNVLSKIDREYDMDTKIETVKISINAAAIKTGTK